MSKESELHRLCKERASIDEIREYLSKRPDLLECVDWMGHTCLANAVLEKRTDLVNLLLENGANPNRGDITGATPYGLACRHGMRGLARMMRDEYGAKTSYVGSSVLKFTISSNLEETIEVLEDLLKEKEITDEDRIWGFVEALGLNDGNKTIERKMKLLLNDGLAVTDNLMGQTLLHIAVKEDSIIGVGFLLEHGCPVERRNDAGESALEMAERLEKKNHVEIIALLENKELSRETDAGEVKGRKVRSRL